MNTILNVEKICKSFGKNKVLNEVSFKIKKGQILGFIGPNGAGKTTAIKLILGLQLMDSGEVYINNYNIKKDYENAIAKVGAIVENPDLYLFLTWRQNLRLFSRYYGEVDEKYLDYLLEKVNLIERADDKVSNYSLGMRQRLGIAVSLINHPNLLVLDEPTNGLDPEGIKDLRDIIIKLAKTENIGVLISSHNLAELDGFCNRICLIDKGQIIKDINLDTLKNSEKPVFFIKLDKLSKIGVGIAFSPIRNKKLFNKSHSFQCLVKYFSEKIGFFSNSMEDNSDFNLLIPLKISSYFKDKIAVASFKTSFLRS